MGVLFDFVKGLGGAVLRPVSAVGNGLVDMFGSSIASARDLFGGEGSNETAKWKMYRTGAKNERDADLKMAGRALSGASSLADLALMVGTGGASKALTTGIKGVATNGMQGLVGGLADELAEHGENYDGERALKRGIAGATTGAVTAGVGSRMSKAIDSNSKNKLLNNFVTRNNIGRGAAMGALGGGISGAMIADANGQDVFSGALFGIGRGALAGGTMSGALSLGSKLGTGIVNKIDDKYSAMVNKKAIDRLASGLEFGADGDIKFVRMDKPLFEDINNIRRSNGLDPLDYRQVTAYKNAVNNNLNNRVKEGMPAYDVAKIAYDSLTSPKSEAFMGKGANQLVMAPYGKKKYNGTVLGKAQDGGTSLKSVEPRDASMVNRLKTEKIGQNDLLGSPLVGSQERGVVYNGSDAPNISLSDQRPGLIGTLQGAHEPIIPQSTKDVNPNKVHLAKELRLKSAQSLLDQYGTIDKPMARSANALENVQKVADAGFIKPGEVEDIISKITGENGNVTKLTRKLVSNAKPVNTFDGIESMIEDQIALNGLLGISEGKAVKASIKAHLSRLDSRRKGTISGLDDPSDTFDVIKALEKHSAELKGKSGNNYRLTTPDKTNAAKVVDSVAEVLKDRLYSGANIKSVLAPDVAAELKSFAPNNKKWSNYVDNVIMKSKDIGELRSTVAPFVNMGKVIENQYMNYGTFGSRVGNAINRNGLMGFVSSVPGVGKVANVVADLPAAKRLQAKAYTSAADKIENGATASIKNSPTSLSSLAAAISQNNNTPPHFYNVASREAGRGLTNEYQSSIDSQKRGRSQLGANNSSQPRIRLSNGDIVDINMVGEAYMNAQAAGDQAAMAELDAMGSALFEASQKGVNEIIDFGQMVSKNEDVMEKLSALGKAALQAGDIKAFAQAAQLYKTAEAMYGVNDEKAESKLSSSEKSKLAEIQTSLDTLGQMENLLEKAGGAQEAVGGSLQNLANFVTGGAANYNLANYNGMRDSLGMAIIKNLVNLGATEQDAKRYAAMLPTVTSSKAQAKQAFDTIRTLLEKGQQNVYKLAQ